MKSHNTDFAISTLNGALMESRIADRILSCNEDSKKYGLTLTGKQARALADTRTNALKRTGRVEFGEVIIHRIISSFCDSPYIWQQNYEETLHELVDLFYQFKSDTWEAVSDDELIMFMKDAFNDECHGSLELLSGKALAELSKHIHSGHSFESFRLSGGGRHE